MNVDKLREAYVSLGFGSARELKEVLAPDVEIVDHEGRVTRITAWPDPQTALDAVEAETA